ncbi:MAG: LTA synthase family protein [bacterium]|nr:LTA synthase family protein [bacterium]
MKRVRQGIGAVCLLVNPALMYVTFEWITGNLTNIHGRYLLFNLAIFYAVYLTVFALSNAPRISNTILNAIFTFWAMAEYFVVDFRARPIMIWDILAVRTAISVSANYEYVFTKRLLAAAAGMALWTVFLCCFPVRLPSWKKQWKIRLAALGGSLAASVAFFVFLFQVAFANRGIDINMWEPVGSYADFGYMLSTVRIVDYFFVEEPLDYSVMAVQEIQRELGESQEERRKQIEAESTWTTKSEVVPTNIICIMNESYSDLQAVAPFETDVPYNAYYRSMEENVIKGNLYMPVFGAMTCNSEYEVLTGNSLAFAPEGCVPYQIYMKNPTPSLAHVLKKQGYRTVAMHPNAAQNWNRTEAYEAMGFDEYYDIAFYEDAARVRGYVGDKGDYEKIIQLTEEKEEGEPLFIFNVTMQNHGGYVDDYEISVHLSDYDGEEFPLTEEYLSLVKESDEALQYLLEYYSEVEEPTMVVMFGDHQPGIETEFYETLMGKELDKFTLEEMLCRYVTPFFIWTNYETESSLSENVSAQYLSCAMLQRANLQMSPYQEFLSEMALAAPVVHMLGYYDGEMQFQDWVNWREKKEYEWFHPFEILQYNNMFEKRRNNELFFLPD